jgi:tRNA(fMet)-specific endonuclease VapC
MIAFDADVLTLMAEGDASCLQRAALIPEAEHTVPIVAAEQVIRGRLNMVRQAQAGKSKITIERAYSLLEGSIADLQNFLMLAHTSQAESLVQSWRKQKIKVGISDLRIAAICIVHAAKLISRNRRDFDQVPGLLVEYW